MPQPAPPSSPHPYPAATILDLQRSTPTQRAAAAAAATAGSTTRGSSSSSTIVASITTTTTTTTASATMLKRKLDESGEGEGPENSTTSNGQMESDDSNCSAGSMDALAPGVASGPSPPKRMKKKVNFKGVTVYYFPRRQGFTCVPSEGGSTLGMSEKHSFTRDFSLSDYSKEQKRIHRAIIAEQRRQGKMFPSPLLTTSLQPSDHDDDVSSGSESDSEYDDYYFLQPLPIRQRRVLLRTAGVKKIDNEEKDECRDIRVSRNICGCDCKVFCDPATCACSVAGIQCQVDRLSFPCGCTKDGCGNPSGRIEFNPIRVRTHFIHTLMRLELERKDSECVEGGNSAAATTQMAVSSPSSVSGEIDVVGANGEADGEASSVGKSNGVNDDGGSGASMETKSNGKLVLKSRLKAKKAESIDLNLYNSNERGSCRDCQNTDMCNVMMHDVKFSMVSQQRQQQQQQHIITTVLGPQPGFPGSPVPHHLGLPPGISLLHPPPTPPSQQQSPQHMLLFNDGEDEAYQAENTTSMYFDNDDSSFSELSDTSPEVMEPRPFANLGQASFSGKFHVTPSQMFTTSISAVNNNSNNNGVQSQAAAMSTQTSLLNPSCIQSLQANGACRTNTSSASSNNMGVQQQQQCGLLSASHPQRPATAASGQSLLRPPYLHGPLSPSGPCVGSPMALSVLAQNGALPRSPMTASLRMDMTDNAMILPGSVSAYQSKFSQEESPLHPGPSPYKLEPSMINSHGMYGQGSSPDYMSQSGHISNTRSPPAMAGYESSSVSTNSGGFETHQGPQLSLCWSASLASPTLRECYGLGGTTSSSSPPSGSTIEHHHATPGSGATDTTCISPSYTAAGLEPCAITASSPASPSSPTTTYATMTTTTRDRLAAHCPGISSHMDNRLDHSLDNPSALKHPASSPSFPEYHPLSEGSSDTSRLVGSSQNLLYSLPYPDTTSTIKSCSGDRTATHTPATVADKKSTDTCETVTSTSNTVQPQLASSSLSSSHSPCVPLEPGQPAPDSLSSSSSSSSVSSSSTSSSSSSSLCAGSGLLDTNGQTVTASTALDHSPASTLEHLPTSTHGASSAQLSFPSPSQLGQAPGVVATAEDQSTLTAAATKSYNDTVKPDKGSEHLDVRQADSVSGKQGCVSEVDVDKCLQLSSGNGKSETRDSDNVKSVSTDSSDKQRDLKGCDAGTVGTESSSASTAASAGVTSAASSSSLTSPLPTTSEEDKDVTKSQNFGEIIKESIVEMVSA